MTFSRASVAQVRTRLAELSRRADNRYKEVHLNIHELINLNLEATVALIELY